VPEKNSTEQLIEDLLAGRIKSDPAVEKEIGLRGNRACELMRECINSIPRTVPELKPVFAGGFKKGRCLLEGDHSDLIILACVEKHLNVHAFASFYFGKTYGKYPVGDWEVDKDVPRTPKVGYFLLNSEQLGVGQKFDFSIWLRDGQDLPAFEERLQRLRDNMNAYIQNILPMCLERVAAVNPKGYARSK